PRLYQEATRPILASITTCAICPLIVDHAQRAFQQLGCLRRCHTGHLPHDACSTAPRHLSNLPVGPCVVRVLAQPPLAARQTRCASLFWRYLVALAFDCCLARPGL